MLQKIPYMEMKLRLPEHLLMRVDKLTMAHAVEARVPFLDHDVVDFATRLPASYKLRDGVGKRLLKRAMRSRLPVAHFRAPKRGFVGPTSAWLRNELQGMLHDELSPERQRRLGYFEPSAVAMLLREHLTGQQNQERMLWALLCFSTWHRLYLE